MARVRAWETCRLTWSGAWGAVGCDASSSFIPTQLIHKLGEAAGLGAGLDGPITQGSQGSLVGHCRGRRGRPTLGGGSWLDRAAGWHLPIQLRDQDTA